MSFQLTRLIERQASHPPDEAGDGEPASRRGLLVWHPAGVFFALCAAIAAALPWLWLLPLADPSQAHIRLGIFGFGGMAVSGYLLTAQRSWTGRDPPLPALFLGVLALGARIVAIVRPDMIWPVVLPLLVIALTILLPVLRARRWDRLPLALAPLGLIVLETALTRQQIPAALLPAAMALLILTVGGRMIPAFLAEERRRRGLPDKPASPVWPGLALISLGLALEGPPGLLALAASALWVFHRALGGFYAWPATRMLCLGYAALALGILGIPAARLGLIPPLAQTHLLTMGAMGAMVMAVAGRVSMRRVDGIGLMPLARHRLALWLLLLATGMRCLAEIVPAHEALISAAGIVWSAAWLLFLSAHLTALGRPTPFPLLSARRI